MAPIVEELDDEYDTELTVEKIETDEETERVNAHNVQALPTIVLLQDGETQDRFTGVTPKDELDTAIASLIEG
jgi:thioredoxin 1